MSTAIVGSIVLGTFLAVGYKTIKKRKDGGSCSCGCSSCMNKNLCHK